jgi:MFS family permease
MDGNERAIVSFTGLAHALVHTYELSTPIFVVVWLTEFPVTTATLGTVVAVGYALGLFADSALAAEFDLASSLYVGLLTVGIGGQYAGGKLTDRIPTAVGMVAVFAGLAVVAVAFVPAAGAGIAPLLAVSAILGFLLFALQPLYQATIAENSPPGGRGLSYGYTYLYSFGVGAAGAAISGYLLSAVGVRGTFLRLALFPLFGLTVAVALWRLGDG